MTYLALTNISKQFAQTTVVQDFNLDVNSGEFVSFLGPSGCGKTTTLRMIAGFEVPTSGKVTLGDVDITDKAPNQRNVGMVFQAYALFPNMTVAQNIGFGMQINKESKSAIKQRVEEMLTMIHLEQKGNSYPNQLSGGQQQRVALARALANRPKVLLLDEPLSALDAKIRVSLRAEIRAIQRKLGITAIYVTHDQEEALSISDRIVVMYEGKIEQVGTPFEIYNFPQTAFVANFVGAQFTATSMIGMIALAGIIVRNSILLVDFINLEVAQGRDFETAIVRAGATRAKPIILTALAAMLGALFILDDPIFNGLAVSLLFGIFVSTILTLVVIPVLYYAANWKRHTSRAH